MLSAVENYGHVTPEIKRLLAEIRAWLDALPPAPPEIREDGLWSCHGIARAALRKWCLNIKGWRVCDGYFMGKYQHSWLALKLNEREGLILDLYPVASTGGPLLFEAMSPASPWRGLYDEVPRAFEARRDAIHLEAAACLRAA